MSIEKLRPSFTFTEDRLKELQSVVPILRRASVKA